MKLYHDVAQLSRAYSFVRLTTALLALILLSSWLVRQQITNFSFRYVSVTNHVNIDDCKEFNNWPDFELIVTAPAMETGLWEYQTLILPSLALFWPIRHFKFRIITDHEGGDIFCQKVIDITNSTVGVVPNCTLSDKIINYGWHHSQWLKFWIDNFTSSEYVGIIDTDSPIVTRVTKYDLFRDGKPIVRPLFGKTRVAWPGWKDTPNTTFRATGFKEVFNCMTFFPVIIKLKHLRVFREVIRSHVAPADGFNNAFLPLMPTESEYSIMCAIMWNMFRDDYYWIINEVEVGWKGHGDGQVERFEEAGISSALVGPDPSLTMHWTYQGTPDPKELFRKGICYSLADRDPKKPAYCSFYGNRTTEINKWQFQFESDDLSNRTGALDSHFKRLAVIDKCPHEWIDAELSKWS